MPTPRSEAQSQLADFHPILQTIPEYAELVDEIALQAEPIVPVFLDGNLIKHRIDKDGQLFGIDSGTVGCGVSRRVVLVDRDNPLRTDERPGYKSLILGDMTLRIVIKDQEIGFDHTIGEHFRQTSPTVIADYEDSSVRRDDGARLFAYNFPSVAQRYSQYSTAGATFVGWENMIGKRLMYYFSNTPMDSMADIAQSMNPIARQLFMKTLGIDFNPGIAEDLSEARSAYETAISDISSRYGIRAS